MKHNDNIRTFKGAAYEEMLHAVAASTYNPAQLYCTGNGVIYAIELEKNKIGLFYLGTLVAVIDKAEETVIHLPGYNFGTTFSNVMWGLKSAFDHYKRTAVSHIDYKFKDIIKAHNKYDFSSNQNMINSLTLLKETAKYYNIDTDNKFYEMAAKKIEKKQERDRIAEERRKAEEEAQRQKRLAVIAEFVPYIQEKLKAFKDSYHKLKFMKNITGSYEVQEIPKGYEHLFEPSYKWDPHCRYFELKGGVRDSDFYGLLDIRLIDRYKMYHNEYRKEDLPDGITCLDGVLLTTQGCKVTVTKEFKKLYNLLMRKIKAKEDCSEYYGTAVGDYALREVDYVQNTIRVGCHCFLFEDVFELASKIKQVKCE